MSGDVQPRKRKDKRKKKDDEEHVLQHQGSIGGSDEVIHVFKETKLGGNVIAKIVFFGLLGALGVMVGLIIIEYHGSNDVETQSAVDSPWSVMLEGWVDDSAGDHDDHEAHPDDHGDEHDDHDEHDEQHDEHDDHEEESSEGEHDEETEDEVVSESFVKQTYEDLKAAYNQLTPDVSDTEPTDDYSAKTDDYPRTESEPEPEPSESEGEGEEEEEEQEDDPYGQWKSENGPKLLAKEVEEAQTGSEDETEEESSDEASAPVQSGGPNSSEIEDTAATANSGQDESLEPLEIENDENKEESVEQSEDMNEADWEIDEGLAEAERDLDEGNPSSALSKFSALLTSRPRCGRALHGKARALDALAEVRHSNTLLLQAIEAYLAALQAPRLPDTLLIAIANRTIDRMRLGEARAVLEEAHQAWPQDPLCRGYLGLTLKLLGLAGPAVPHLTASLESEDPRTLVSHFYFHLGDALQRLKQNDEAMKVYEAAAAKGIFRSKYQRSLYNVDRLKSQPWWTLEETTYSPFFKKLESMWKDIKAEGLAAYKSRRGFLDEAESLRDVGDWKQYELFARGHKYEKNCKSAPVTCGLVEELRAAAGCRRGQVKFSIMEGGTHVWPHCGPTNCRLRAHLGLVVPPGTALRVAQHTRTWEEGRVLVFDDSFEHEVWHNGTQQRLVLIVDVWHPELTAAERASLSTI